MPQQIHNLQEQTAQYCIVFDDDGDDNNEEGISAMRLYYIITQPDGNVNE